MEIIGLEHADVRQTFLGNCMGVALATRGPDDLHVCFHILTEDDTNWFSGSGGGTSSSWLKELLSQLDAAEAWVDENCEPDIHKGTQYGWRFKDGN